MYLVAHGKGGLKIPAVRYSLLRLVERLHERAPSMPRLVTHSIRACNVYTRAADICAWAWQYIYTMRCATYQNKVQVALLQIPPPQQHDCSVIFNSKKLILYRKVYCIAS